MFKLLDKIVPMFFRKLSSRSISTLASEKFAMLAAKRLKWKLPKDLPLFSNLLYERKDYTIELGNFPEESLYILRQEGREVYRFDVFPDKWILPKNSIPKKRLI